MQLQANSTSSPGGSIPPLSTVTFADAGTGVVTPDGSIAAPYAQLQAAIAARLASGGRQSFYCTPGSYAAVTVAHAATSLSILGMAPFSLSAPIGSDTDSGVNPVIVASVTVNSAIGLVQLANVHLTGNYSRAGGTVLQMVGCSVFGVVSQGDNTVLDPDKFVNCVFLSGDETTTQFHLASAITTFQGCFFRNAGAIEASGTELFFIDCQWSGAQDLHLTDGCFVVWDSISEHAFWAQGGTVDSDTTPIVFKSLDVDMPDTQIATGANETFTDVPRVTYAPGTTAGDITVTLVHANDVRFGMIIDIWGIANSITIQTDTAVELVVYTPDLGNIRYIFFGDVTEGPASLPYALSGVQQIPTGVS